MESPMDSLSLARLEELPGLSVSLPYKSFSPSGVSALRNAEMVKRHVVWGGMAR